MKWLVNTSLGMVDSFRHGVTVGFISGNDRNADAGCRFEGKKRNLMPRGHGVAFISRGLDGWKVGTTRKSVI